MAHNLSMFRDRPSFSYNADAMLKKPWHHLGVPVEGLMTSEQALRTAGLDYTVTEKEMTVFTDDGDIPVQDYKLICREEYVGKRYKFAQFAVVGKGYTLVQNEEAFTFFDSLVESGEAVYDTAGSLFDGQIVFISAKIRQGSFLVVGDTIDNYVLLVNHHDGSGSFKVMFTPVRVVCNNTLNAALSQKEKIISFKHTGNIAQRLDYTSQVMKSSQKVAEVSKNHLKKLTELKFTTDEYNLMLFKALNIGYDKVGSYEEIQKMAKDPKVMSTRVSNKFETLLSLDKHHTQERLEASTAYRGLNLLSLFAKSDEGMSGKVTEEKVLRNSFLGGSGVRHQEKFIELVYGN